uniref:Uncharacterized protein n=1 Tax=Anguilla anguilla TaxID=7936 RepID=A0A0E9T101_ANGAN
MLTTHYLLLIQELKPKELVAPGTHLKICSLSERPKNREVI